ncbi:MAG: hypothetical protein GX896_03260 [Clostridiales bacterium]|nr:hypothetical protein [Clostridiales bacterium]
MKNLFKKLLSLSLSVLTLCLFFSITAFAEGTVSITTSSNDVAVGGEITVVVNFSSTDKDIQSAEARLEYDDSIIEISSDSPVKGTGGIALLKGFADNSDTISFTIKFKSLKTGTSKLKLTDSYLTNQSNDSLGSPTGEKSISVLGADDPVIGDSTLRSIELSEGTLTPAFSPDITEYTVEIGSDVKSLYVTGQTNVPKALIWFSGGFEEVKPVSGRSPLPYKGKIVIAEGDNKRTIRVTAVDGTQTSYNINFKVGAGATTTPPTTSTKNPSSDPTTSTEIGQGSNIIKNSISTAPLNNSKGPNDDNFLNKILPMLIILIFFVALALFMIITWLKYKRNKNNKASRNGRPRPNNSNSRNINSNTRRPQSRSNESQKSVKTTVRKSNKNDFKRPR